MNLSIIIPHYNSVDLLKKLLSSIPNKKEIQIIVIDDRSDKNTEDLNTLITSQEYEHVTFMRNNTSVKGAGTCRNIGLQEAKGKWLLFADADDFFVEGFYDIVKRDFNSEEDVVFYSPTSIYLDTGKLANRHIQYEKLVKNFLENKNLKNEVKLRYQYVFPVSKLIKRDLVEKHNIFFDEVIAMNDIMFSTKVGYYAKKIKANKEVMYCITRSKGSLTMNMSKKVHDARTDTYIRYCNFLNENLSKTQTKYLELSALHTLLRGYRSKVGFLKLISTYKKFKQNNIKLMEIKYINPIFLIKKAIHYRKKHKLERKYYQK